MTSVGSVELRPKVMTVDDAAPGISVANQAPAHSFGSRIVSTVSHRKGENTIRSEESGTVTFWTFIRTASCAVTKMEQREKREIQKISPKTVLLYWPMVTSAKGGRSSWGIVHIHEAVRRTSDARDLVEGSEDRVRARTESRRNPTQMRRDLGR